MRSIRALECIGGICFVFLTINGGPPVALDSGHDAFQWAAEIWIPSGVGVLTLITAVIALWISHRATKLAEAVESQRQAAEDERTRTESRARLQGMALEEARALTRWVNVAARNRFWASQDLADTGPAQHGPTLLAEARVFLQQSLLPAAEELLDITELEIENFTKLIPDAMYMPDRVVRGYYASSAILSRVSLYRRDRALSRIRDWALDPEGAKQRIDADLDASEDEQAFWDYRRGLGPTGRQLPPLADLPRPPQLSADRKAFFEAQGYGPDRVF